MTLEGLTGANLVNILKVYPEFPVILCTGYNEMIKAEARNIGFAGFLIKPIVLRDLALLVREVPDQRFSFNR